ncbi:MAG: hypothetical protein FJ271_00445 [Planctomycetes bacterium]|nr:hypothetical protein [Planctomycetota bacterium]
MNRDDADTGSKEQFPEPIQTTQPISARSHWSGLRLAFLGVILIAAATLLAERFFPFFFRSDPPIIEKEAAPDPRRSYLGPFQNVHPDVKYVGTDACAGCHDDIAGTYLHSPMALSLIPMAQLSGSQSYDKASNNPFLFQESAFRVERRGKRVYHHEVHLDASKRPDFETAVEAQFAIGSGSHGHSYLSFLGDGFLFQTAISWYSQKKIWDNSPGFTVQRLRPVKGACLFCHTNLAFPREDTINQFEPPYISGHAIGCERCHGPGEKHVRQQRLQSVAEEMRPFLRERVRRLDASIVHPGKLRHDLREAVCQQCHLEGENRVLPRQRGLFDYRPGMPLDQFVSTFVHPRETGLDKKAVNHVEQMYLSRCFERSHGDNKLGCITCHNPHQRVRPEETVVHYRERCLRCHAVAKDKGGDERTSCSLSLAERSRNADNCAACHMPRYSSSDIAHAASTDHRIVRKPQPPDKEGPEPPPGHGQGLPLAHFHRGKIDLADKSLSRDLGIAMIQLIAKGKLDPRHTSSAIRILESALVDDPDDVTAWEIKAYGLFLERRLAESLAAYETVLQKRPNREISLSMAAAAAQVLGRLEPATDYWQRAVAVNPWMANYRDNLARLLASKQDWQGVLVHSRHWLHLDPGNADARKTWLDALRRTGYRGDPNAAFSRSEPTGKEVLSTKVHFPSP